jgi:hypothetical protein
VPVQNYLGWIVTIAWLAAVVIVGLPLAFWLVNRIPTVLTLRPRREQYAMITGPDGVTRMHRLATPQSSLLVRLVYFVLVRWW